MDDAFRCDLEARAGDELWVLPRGELDLAATLELEEALALALASDAGAIVVDLRGLELLDSTGLRALLAASGAEGGERISFVQGGDMVAAVLRVSGVIDGLPFRTVED